MANLLLGALPIYASIVGRRAGVEVEIGGHEARTNGKKIVLPAIDPSDARAATLAYGYLGHEIGHVRYTDFGIDPSGWSQLKRDIHNAFEDVFVERELAKPYPGIAWDIDQLLEQLVDEKTFTEVAPDEHPASVLQKYLLYRMRLEHLGQEAFRALAQQAEEAFRARVAPGFAAKVGALIARAASATSTADTAALAEELMQLLKDEAEQKNPAGANGPAETTPQGQAMSEVAQQILSVQDGTLQQDLGALVAAKLSEAASGSDSRRVAGVGRAEPPPAVVPCGRELLSRTRQATNALRVRLAGLVEASIEEEEDRGPYGLRLDNCHVYRVRLQERNVFLQERETRDVNTAVVVLFDRSSSMRDDIALARETALAVTSALEETPGVAACCAAFPSHVANGVVPLTAFGESSRATAGRYQALVASGGTPMAEAIWWAAVELYARPEPRKILFVVTDGEPANRPACENGIRLLREAGVELLGLGIKAEAVNTLFPNAKVIHSLKDLPAAVFGMLQEQLIRRVA